MDYRINGWGSIPAAASAPALAPVNAAAAAVQKQWDFRAWRLRLPADAAEALVQLETPFWKEHGEIFLKVLRERLLEEAALRALPAPTDDDVAALAALWATPTVVPNYDSVEVDHSREIPSLLPAAATPQPPPLQNSFRVSYPNGQVDEGRHEDGILVEGFRTLTEGSNHYRMEIRNGQYWKGVGEWISPEGNKWVGTWHEGRFVMGNITFQNPRSNLYIYDCLPQDGHGKWEADGMLYDGVWKKGHFEGEKTHLQILRSDSGSTTDVG